MNTLYTAPEGKLYDWAEPHIARMVETDGTITETVEHLYAKYLSIGRADNIKNYKLIDDPRVIKNVEQDKN